MFEVVIEKRILTLVCFIWRKVNLNRFFPESEMFKLSLNCIFIPQQEIMVGSMYQAETPVGLCKYKDNEKG